MSANGKRTESRKLPVFASVARAYWNVFSRPRRLVVIAVAPAAATCAITGLFYLTLRNGSVVNELGLSCLLLLWFPLSYLGLAWAKQSSRDSQPKLFSVRPWSGIYFGSFACHLLWVPFFYFTLVAAPMLSVELAQTAFAPDGDSRQPVLVGVPEPTTIVLVFLSVSLIPAALGRFFLVLPIAATSIRASARAAWIAGSGFTARLACAAFVMATSHFVLAVFFLFVAIVGIEVVLYRHMLDIALVDTAYIHIRIALLVTCVVVLPLGTVIAETLFAELIAVAYRQTTGWSSLQIDIAERFD
jgi:hypothetical protein